MRIWRKTVKKCYLAGIATMVLICHTGRTDLSVEDNFNDNTLDTTKWASFQGNWTFSEINQRLEFTRADADPTQWRDRVLTWVQNHGSYSRNWEMEVEVFIDPGISIDVGDVHYVGFGVFNSADQGDSYSISLEADDWDGDALRGFLSEFTLGDWDDAQEVLTPTDGVYTQGTVRLEFNAETKTLRTSYRAGGSFIELSRYSIGSGANAWDMSPSDNFTVMVFAGSARSSVASGQIYLDNFVAHTEDTTPPTINCDPGEMILSLGDQAPDLMSGVTALDNVDGDITDRILVGGNTVDTSRPGDYTVIYNVSDQAGNPAVQCTRTYRMLCQVTAEAGDGGSVLPTQVAMGAEDTQIFTATPDGHYAMHEWHLDGNVVQQSGEEYTLTAPVSNHLLQVSFRVPDDDNDGMPNWWENQYERDLAPDADDDGDGIPNIVEYQESLNPTIQDDIDYLILGEGWNLVAVPAAGERETFAAFFDGKAIGRIWAWEHEGQGYEVADDDEIDPKRGVWVYVTDMCGIPLE